MNKRNVYIVCFGMPGYLPDYGVMVPNLKEARQIQKFERDEMENPNVYIDGPFDWVARAHGNGGASDPDNISKTDFIQGWNETW